MTIKTIKTITGETLNIAKVGSKKWYGTHVYGLTKKVVWEDENGGMWVRVSGEWRKVEYRVWGSFGQYTDTSSVMEFVRFTAVDAA